MLIRSSSRKSESRKPPVRTAPIAPSKIVILPLGDRLRNVAGAFSIRGSVKDKVIVLVDDVYKSGATIDELRYQLFLEAGARAVYVVTGAKTKYND